MKQQRFFLSGLLIVSLAALFAPPTQASWGFGPKVVTASAPAGEPLSTDYELWVHDKKVDIYTARVLDAPFSQQGYNYGGPYSFANFDMNGKVSLRIVSKRSLRNTVIRPSNAVSSMVHQDDHTLILTLKHPHKFSVEPDGKNGPLLVFANPLEKNPPKTNSLGVIYFGPGIHKANRVIATNNQTVYLAAGAVVKGGIVAHGNNIRITGRGIIDGSDWPWLKGPTPVDIIGTNIEVSGITIRGSSTWTVVPKHSCHVTVRNIKICGGRVQNDDGINPCNSQDVLITDCFIRTDDDCVAMKGLELSVPNNNVERVTVENCVLWCDRARIFLLGHESRANFMRQITLHNLDIVHFTMTAFLFEPGEDMRLEDVNVSKVRVNGEGQRELIRLKPVVNQYMRKQTPGYVQNISFKDLEVTGAPGSYLIQVEGANPEHSAHDAVFDKVLILGQPVTKASSNVQIGSNAEEISFKN